jgi:hypothetical protein
MLVSNLQQFLVLLLPPLRAAGLNATADKSVTSSLEAMATALDPFKDLSIEQVADLLKVTQEYRHTGQIPDWVLARKPPASKARTSTPKTSKKAPKPPKMTPAEALGKLRDLQSRSPDLEFEQITQELVELESLTKDELKVVQKEFLGAISGKNKADLLAALKREIFSDRESRLRSKGILDM